MTVQPHKGACQTCGHLRRFHESVLPPAGACSMPGCQCNAFARAGSGYSTGEPARSCPGESTKGATEVYCGAFYGPPMPPIGEPAECGMTFMVEQDDPVEPSRSAVCPRCGADCEVEW